MDYKHYGIDNYTFFQILILMISFCDTFHPYYQVMNYNDD